MTAVSAIVLAAGQSRRMPGANKLLLETGAGPLAGVMVRELLRAGLAETIVVTGFEAERVREALSGYPVRFVHNRRHALGMSESIKAGLRALARSAAAFVVCLADMPGVSHRTVRELVAAFDPERGIGICVPAIGGRRGNPVLWARRFAPALMELDGDRGAKALLERYRGEVVEVPVADPGILLDVDTGADFAALAGERP